MQPPVTRSRRCLSKPTVVKPSFDPAGIIDVQAIALRINAWFRLLILLALARYADRLILLRYLPSRHPDVCGRLGKKCGFAVDGARCLSSNYAPRRLIPARCALSTLRSSHTLELSNERDALSADICSSMPQSI